MSTRSAKRRKLSLDEPPQPSSASGFLQKNKNAVIPQSLSRNPPRPVITYGSSKKRKTFLHGAPSIANLDDTEDCAAELQKSGVATFADLAHQSITTQEELSDVETSEKQSTVRTTRLALANDFTSQPTSSRGSEMERVQETPSKRRRPTRAKIDKSGTHVDMHAHIALDTTNRFEDDNESVVTIAETPLTTKSLNITAMESPQDDYPNQRRLHSKKVLTGEEYQVTTNGKEELDSNHENELLDTIVVMDDSQQGSADVEIHETPVRSSGRQRKPTRQLLEIQMAKKAVVTPTKSPGRKRGRPPNVAPTPSRPPQTEIELHFKDIPGKIDSKGATPAREDEISPSGQAMLAKHQPVSPKITKDRPSSRITPAGSIESQHSPQEDQSTEHYLKHLTSVLNNENMELLFVLLQNYILDGLTGQRRLPLIGHDEEFQKVLQLLQQTIYAGEGNSMLVIGARGSGKTTLVENAILQAQSSDGRHHQEDFYVVRLNGFIHTDDKLALKEIWRQLGEQMQVDDETISADSNYADTLASLLALLSHPAEHFGATTEEGLTSKSVIFIIDEFDLFTSHPRQTLLYNLFDIAQSRKAPIAVLGLTTKVSVVESLEKRVKSRFSHRYVYLSLPKSFGVFRDICKFTLLCESSELDADLMETPGDRKLTENPMFRKLHAAWSKYMTSVLTDDPALTDMLGRIYAHTKSVPEFMSSCLLPIVSMTPHNIPSAADFTSNTLPAPDSKLDILPGLSEVELALLIAAARLDIILDTDTCNFNMAYDEYTSLASRAKMLSSASGAAAVGGGARVWGRDVALGAWERLELLELLVPALGAGGGAAMAEVGRSGKLWKVDVGLEEIGASQLEMGSVMAKWCKEI
ncbi:hypothetical protein MMC34_003665 [Xylographa carneopallida]|nr:hypothetical protein [Xylographa carneopallida]